MHDASGPIAAIVSDTEPRENHRDLSILIGYTGNPR
jgi:hypothetical protein